MRQKYSKASNEPIFDAVVKELYQLKGLSVLKWYRGMVHTLHIHFGEGNVEIINSKDGTKEKITGDYSLFLHGEWELANKATVVSSFQNVSAQIDAFVDTHELNDCADVLINKAGKTLHLRFSDGTTLTAYDRDRSWFVFEKFGVYSYSPKGESGVEVSHITLEM